MIVSGVMTPQALQQRHQVANQELQEKIERFPKEDAVADQKRNQNTVSNQQDFVRILSDSVSRGRSLDLYV